MCNQFRSRARHHAISIGVLQRRIARNLGTFAPSIQNTATMAFWRGHGKIL
jgi:hypothetical protein